MVVTQLRWWVLERPVCLLAAAAAEGRGRGILMGSCLRNKWGRAAGHWRSQDHLINGAREETKTMPKGTLESSGTFPLPNCQVPALWALPNRCPTHVWMDLSHSQDRSSKRWGLRAPAPTSLSALPARRRTHKGFSPFLSHVGPEGRQQGGPPPLKLALQV